jgi:hypothetical protein
MVFCSTPDAGAVHALRSTNGHASISRSRPPTHTHADRPDLRRDGLPHGPVRPPLLRHDGRRLRVLKPHVVEEYRAGRAAPPDRTTLWGAERLGMGMSVDRAGRARLENLADDGDMPIVPAAPARRPPTTNQRRGEHSVGPEASACAGGEEGGAESGSGRRADG